jgi:hypothetical protein
VIYPGSTPVGNATLVVANVLTCNKHSHMSLRSMMLLAATCSCCQLLAAGWWQLLSVKVCARWVSGSS